MAAANVLLHSEGRCDGCDSEIDLSGPDARDRVRIRTVDYETGPFRRTADESREDWPAALCDECHREMREGAFETFLDYRFSKHPRCPECEGQRTSSAS